MKTKTVNWLRVGMLLICLVFFAACGGGGGGGSSTPTTPPATNVSVASFTTEVTGLSVQFFGSGTESPTGYFWDFDDNGATSTEQNPVHVFSPGTHNPSLIVTNPAGLSLPVTLTITVTDVVIPPPVIDPTLPRVKVEGFPAIPAAEYTEAITVAFNEEFTSTHPDWQVKVQTFIDHVNTVLNRSPGNKKQYRVGQFKTYKTSEASAISANPQYFYDNNFASGVGGGTTLVVYMANSLADIPAIFLNSRGTYSSATRTVVSGKKYGIAWSANLISQSIFSEVPAAIKTSIPNWYEVMASGFIHELGHTDGSANDEWYVAYLFDDLTGSLPKLGHYDHRDYYPLDLMFSLMMAGQNDIALQFSPINSWIINNNADHRYDSTEITYATPATIKIKVVDAVGNPVQGATIKTFGKKLVDVDMKTALQTLATDVNGEVQIKSDDWNSAEYPAKAIKASKAGKYAGMYLTLTDLQIAYLMQGLDSVTYTLTLK